MPEIDQHSKFEPRGVQIVKELGPVFIGQRGNRLLFR